MRPAVSFAQSEVTTGDVAGVGALEASTAVANALAESTAQVDAFNFYGLPNINAVVGFVTEALALGTNLAESERPYFRLRFPEQAAQVLKIARDYLAYVGEPADFPALIAIRDAMAGVRRELSAQADGRGIPAAILLTIAFTVEFGATRRLAGQRELLRAVLDDYRVWSDTMRTMLDGAIPFRRKVAAEDHDIQLSALRNTPYGERLGLANYTIEGSQTEKRIADPCVIFYTQYLSIPAQYRAGFYVSEYQSNIFWNPTFVSWILLGFSRIRTRDSERFGVRMIEFSSGESRAIRTSEVIGGLHSSIRGEFCYPISSHGIGTPAQAISQANDHPNVKSDLESRTSIIAAIHNANACRIEIALSGRAMGMLERFDGVREFFERQI
ncbi:hypothetical protein [Brevundimonas sp.]|uniref:hypothetical protein n=1 Tax=Brevundimonas sp. TaxID=1871086 RepID=UPI0026361448|nr:hypothetical protein [Brevundimonas sp.]